MSEGAKERKQQLIEEYISHSGLPRLAQEQIGELEKPITLTELEQAIKATSLGKAPGPDGFGAEYYRTFQENLGGRFLAAFRQAMVSGELPRTILQANITIILKEGKDPANCNSYRSISLLNADLKLFSKILANRLLPLVDSLVHWDQVGFIPSREG